ncbi:MAG TPA: DUF1236 domain-containing protein, partial [Xanthobacteraceae bacterium]|nr:DUF1236 domain-containing protein [Xanthobacteraceae bacterium]
LALCGTFADAAAQTASDAKPPAGLELSAAQRQLIYASISQQKHKSTAAPPTFGATIGAHVPEAIELSPLPDTIVQMVPQTRGYAYAFIANQVLIVEPRARQVVEIIVHS